MTDSELAVIFETWQQRYRDNPEWFMSVAETAALDVSDYGASAAVYFRALADDLGIRL